VQKLLKRSRCRLDFGLGWAEGSVCYMGHVSGRGSVLWRKERSHRGGGDAPRAPYVPCRPTSKR